MTLSPDHDAEKSAVSEKAEMVITENESADIDLYSFHENLEAGRLIIDPQ